MSPSPADLDGVVDLAATPAFRLGGLEVRPSTREVRGDGAQTIAEPRVLQVLVALAEAQGEVVSRDVLIRRCWEGRIVGEDAINRSIAKVRALSELATPPAFVVETVPRVGYRLLPVSDVGDGGPAVRAQPQPQEARSRRGVLLGGAAVGTLGAVGAGALAWRRFASAPASDPLVAVLPFDNLTPDPQLGFFADGLSEDILGALTRAGGLRVTSRSSSFTFRGAAKSRAAEALKAGYLLDGSVFKEGSRLRVMAHLSDARSQQTLWSETYDRDVAQGLQIEDEIAGQVASALKVRLAPSAKLQIDPQTYELYLRGREAIRGHTPEDGAQGLIYLRMAVQRAPNFAQAWARLARGYWLQGYYEALPEQAKSYALGLAAARRALALDPKMGDANSTIALLTPKTGRWAEIDADLARGMAVSPNDPEVLMPHGQFLIQTGRFKAAVPLMRRVQALDPLELYVNITLGQAFMYARQFKEAAQVQALVTRTWPNQLAAFWGRVQLAMVSGHEADAAALLRDRSLRPPRAPAWDAEVPAMALSAIGAPPEVRRAAARTLLQFAARGFGYANEAMILLSRLGQFDEAVTVAQALYLHQGELKIVPVEFEGYSRFPPHGEASSLYLFHPFVEPLIRAGRLAPIYDGVGLSAFWREGGPEVRPDALR